MRLYITSHGIIIYGHTTIVCTTCRWLTNPKHDADDKLLIQLCIDLFFYSFIDRTVAEGQATIQKTHEVMNNEKSGS